MTASGQSELEQLRARVGLTCRCVSCCCRTGQGHKHPDFERMLELQDAIEEGR